MANIDDAFRIDKLSLNDNILITEGSIDPSSDGYEAHIGSLYFNSVTGAIFHKYGPADTDWNKFGEVDAAAIFAALKAPTGFVSRDTSTLTFDTNTREFLISPLAPALSYAYFIKGAKYAITTPKTVILPDVSGVYYIYFDGTETLIASNTYDGSVFTDFSVVSTIYWNADIQDIVYFGDERHGCDMDGATHAYLHSTLGSRYVTGLALTGFVPEVDDNTALQGVISPGIIRDEDLSHHIVDTGTATNVFDLEQAISGIAQIPVLFRLGVDGRWQYKQADNFPLIYTGTANYTGTLVPCNEWNGSTWNLVEAADGNYVFMHFFATNDIHHPIIAIQGIFQYVEKPSGADQAGTEIWNFQNFYKYTGVYDLPFEEFVPLASIILQTASTILNDTKATIVKTAEGNDYIDWRFTNTAEFAILGIKDHGNLTGLGDDDHTQYALAGAGSNRTFNFGDLINIHDFPRGPANNSQVYGLFWNNGASQYDISNIQFNQLSDVAIVEGAGIDGYMVTWNNTTSKWVAAPAAPILQLYDERAITPTPPAAQGVNTVAIGSGSQTSPGSINAIAIGDQSLAHTSNSLVYASGRFASSGDAQVGTYLLRTNTILSTPTEMFLDGTSGIQRLVLPDNSTWSFTVTITAHVTSGSGPTGGRASYKFDGVVYRDSGANTTTIQGRVQKNVIAESNPAWDANIVANTSTGSLQINVTGEAGKTIRWVAKVETVEITN